MRNRRIAGFTLIELMIVVIIVGALATFAIPSYLDQVRKAQRTQAKTMLLEAAQAQERFYTAQPPPKRYTAQLSELGVPEKSSNDKEQYFRISVLAPTAACPITSCYVLEARRLKTLDVYDLRLSSSGMREHKKEDDSAWRVGWP